MGIDYNKSKIIFDGTYGKYYEETRSKRWHKKMKSENWLAMEWIAVLLDWSPQAGDCGPTRVDITLRVEYLCKGLFIVVLAVLVIFVCVLTGFMIRRRLRKSREARNGAYNNLDE